MSAQRHNIALLVANITDPFSNQIAAGAMRAAERLGADLTIFPGKYVGVDLSSDTYDTTYEYQYNALFDIAAEGGFDYIIAAVGTIAYACDTAGKEAFLERLGDTPLLALAAQIEGYDSLIFDNRSGISAIVDELARQGRRCIGIMAGDIRNNECAERYIAFRESLDRNGLPFNEKYFMASDISERCRAEAEQLIDRAPELDAIVCSNDQIAEVVCKVLRERGKRIGRDVAVTGFDDLPGSAELDPPLATVRADASTLGERAVEKAVHFLDGINDSENRVPTEFILRDSCRREQTAPQGYERLEESEKAVLRKKMADRIHVDNIFVRDAMMFGGELKNSYAKVLKQLPLIGALTGFIYTCDKPVRHAPDEQFPKDVGWSFRSYCCGKEAFTVPDSERKVSAAEVFRNKYLCSERQHCFVVSDLYTAETQYGIALLEPETPEFFSELELVTYILSSAVRTLDILSEQETLLSELHLKNSALEDESKIDLLTGAYNRRGFYLAADRLFYKANSPAKYIIGYADMDDLKVVNDNYGHAEGDLSIKQTAECLRSVFGEEAVIGRFGGDEFAVLCPRPSGMTLATFTRAKDDFVDNVNRFPGRQYKLGISMGLISEVCENSYDLRAALDKADDLMYADKSRKKKNRQ